MRKQLNLLHHKDCFACRSDAIFNKLQLIDVRCKKRRKSEFIQNQKLSEVMTLSTPGRPLFLWQGN